MNEKGENLSKEEKKHFWKIIGIIKRQSNPDLQIVTIASEIRDSLYEQRLGKPKSILPILLIFTFCGSGFILCTILFNNSDYYYFSIILGITTLTIFLLTYIWIINANKNLSLFLLIFFVGGTIVYDFLMLLPDFEILNELNKYYILACVPCFYLYGRLIGGKISGISFDGVTRDVFYLPTLKINYSSYLSAQPPSRQWIFLCGGLGTVVTSFISSIIVLIIYNDPYLFIFPIFLFIGELLDYSGLAGVLSGGEFEHLRREHKIIKDWKNNKFST